MPLATNTLLQAGKYKIVRFISSGGFGCTYEGELVLLRKRVAIKEFFVKDFCNRDKLTSHVTVGTQSKVKLVERLQRKFLEEASALYSMQHQNIIRVTDVFEENGTAYYVMDYVDGDSLQEKVKKDGALPESIALKYIKQVAYALKYVHSQNRLHLDIKPGNIMVNSMDNAILIDFGASKQYDEVDGENTSTLLGKTPGYAPIEQMSNNVKQFTPATDIYSLGATLYKLLTGNTPPDATEIFNEGLDNLPDTISKATNTAVMNAMELRVKNRPQSIDAFLDMLKVEEVTDATPQTTPSNEVIIEGKEEPKQPSNTTCQETETIETVEEKNCEATQVAPEYDHYVDDEFAIDLGLSVKWCSFNLGASNETEYGLYIGWADVTGKLTIADVKHYPSVNPPQNICNTEYDMALALAGKGWRLPTKKEMEELQNLCKWIWCTASNGVSGFKVTGKNGNNIFLPAAGFRTEDKYKSQNVLGHYWTGNLNRCSDEACALFFSEGGPKNWNTRRYFGFSVRPVKD